MLAKSLGLIRNGVGPRKGARLGDKKWGEWKEAGSWG